MPLLVSFRRGGHYVPTDLNSSPPLQRITYRFMSGCGVPLPAMVLELFFLSFTPWRHFSFRYVSHTHLKLLPLSLNRLDVFQGWVGRGKNIR